MEKQKRHIGEGKMWEFREIPAIEEPVFNNVLERFYNLGLDGLVRENIQNISILGFRKL